MTPTRRYLTPKQSARLRARAIAAQVPEGSVVVSRERLERVIENYDCGDCPLYYLCDVKAGDAAQLACTNRLTAWLEGKDTPDGENGD